MVKCLKLKLKVVVSYIKDTYDREGVVIKSEPKLETLTNTLGVWTIINPNFKE